MATKWLSSQEMDAWLAFIETTNDLMKAIEKTLDDLPNIDADTLYERAYALRMGEGVRVNFRAAHRLLMLAALMG